MNSPFTIQVEAKVLGRRPSAADHWRVTISAPNETEPMALRDLITAVATHEVQAFRQRQEQRRLLQILTPDQIAEGAGRGKIVAGGQEFKQVVSEQGAVETALQAFEDGLYYVFLDDTQIESLDLPVQVSEKSRLLFVRLVALVGG